MTLIPRKVIFVDQKIVIGVELPEPTVQYIEVFIGKVLPDHVDIVFIADLLECFVKI